MQLHAKTYPTAGEPISVDCCWGSYLKRDLCGANSDPLDLGLVLLPTAGEAAFGVEHDTLG